MQKYSRSAGYAGGLLVLAFGTYCVLADDSGADTPQPPAQPRVIRSIGDALQEGLLVAPHAAAGRRVVRTSGEAIEAPPQNSVGKSGSTRFRLGADSFTSGFEPPCALGYIGGGGSDDPQNCEWHASNSVPLLATSPVIDDSNEFAGIQHLHFQFDPFQPSGLALGARNWAFSEDIPNPPIGGVMTLKLQLYICLVPKDCVSDSGGLNGYRIRPQAPSEGKATALMWFLSTGEIVVFEDPDDDGTLDGFFPPFTWVPGEYKQVSIVVDNINNRVRYFYDEDLVWSTGAGEGGQGSGVFAGTKIEHVLIRYEDNQNDQTFMDIDDVVIEPGETTLPTGACCNFDGLGGCQRMAEDACAATTTGLYGGLNTDCSAELCTALTVCGQVDTGSCLDPLGTPSPGCEEIECCIQICKVDSLCCENIWDDGCAALAIAECTIPCAHGDTQCQDLGILDAFNSTNGEFQVADNFTPAADGSINSICWSGVYLENPFIEDIFSVRYYECVDGSPTNLIAEFSESDLSLTVTGKVDSGLDLAGFLDIFEYTALHADVPVTAGEVYFIEVSNAPPGGDAWFWEIADITDTDGDGIFFQKPHGEDYARFYKGCRADLSFCLNLELGVLTGLCDVPVPLACVEELQIPKLAILEGEVCGDANNEKCDTATPIVISHDPENPTFVHGQAFAEAGIADNDWYAFDVADLNADDEAVVCVSIVSELPMHTGLVQDLSNACVEDGLIEDLLQSVSLPCDPSLSVAYAVDAPGNFLLHARVADGCGIIEGYPCPNDYVLQLSVANTIEECAGCGLFTCPEDLDQNGEVRVSDLIILLGSWGLCPAEGLCCADFDEDGEVRVPDLITMLGEWGPCVVTLGACCNAGGPGLCETMTASECTNSGGVFLGPQTDCADCPPASCGLGNGDCCTPNGTPGCEEVSCCSAVCEVSSLCCTTDWSAACAAVAEFLCESCFPPPANDNCADATVIFDGDTTFDTSTATTDGPAHEECQFDGQTYNDVWFDYMSTCPGPLTVSTCGQANYDTDVAVYKGCDCPVTDSDLLGCNDDAEECAVFTSQVTVPIQNNQCYKIRIGGFASGNSGTGTVTVTCGG